MKPDDEELRRLYEAERLSTREIGRQFGVTKTSVRRWLTAAEITLRPTGRGLTNRGITAPTKDELHEMVHVDLLTYEQVGERFGVDQSAVLHWLRRHGLPTSDRRQLPDVAEADLREMYESGESIASIAQTVGCAWGSIAKLFDRYGIEARPDGWKRGIRYTCQDGHEVRSVYERRVDNWLSTHSIDHTVDPPLPFGTRMLGDFLARETYIEVWGVTNNPAYTERRRKKETLYVEHGLRLLSLPLSAFDTRWNRWTKKLAEEFL